MHHEKDACLVTTCTISCGLENHCVSLLQETRLDFYINYTTSGQRQNDDFIKLKIYFKAKTSLEDESCFGKLIRE